VPAIQLTPRDFYWMTGFECSAFPQIGADELERTQHYQWWAADLARVQAAGIRLLRYGIPWYRTNPQPHEYDWAWTDSVLDLMTALGLTPIVDLFHYGTPRWIEGGFMHPLFGEIQSWYARAFAERYPQIHYYTPTSDPYLCATFGAEAAVWYPFLRGPENAVRAIKNITEGLCRATQAIRQVRPDALIVVPDSCEYYHALDDASAEAAAFHNTRRFLAHDLYHGAVSPDHPLWDYLLANGLTAGELDWFGPNAIQPDILGLAYYAYSEHGLRHDARGAAVDEPAPQPLGWAALAAQYSARYGGIPVMLTETNMGGPVEARVAWLDTLRAETQAARAAGTPVAGITYYGALDHVDWDTLLRQRNGHINPCGLWTLQRQGDRLLRVPTAALDWYAAQIALPPGESVGAIADPAAQARAAAVLAPLAGPLAPE